MKRITARRVGAVPLIAGLLLAGCAKPASDKYVVRHEPATLEPLPGMVQGVALARVKLTDKAVERLGIETVQVQQDGGTLTVPSGAVIVDATGNRWTYTNPAPLVYVRAAVTVEREAAGTAYLSAGPAAGTEVVTTGAAELHGAETGIGK